MGKDARAKSKGLVLGPNFFKSSIKPINPTDNTTDKKTTKVVKYFGKNTQEIVIDADKPNKIEIPHIVGITGLFFL